MRGSRQPAVRPKISDSQSAFQALSRHRRTKLARAAHTSLVKADQWGRGGATPPEVAAALEGALRALTAKGAKAAKAAPAPAPKKTEKPEKPEKADQE
jgi:hypothetical protein